ncbi:chorion peroxidase [Manduca sexta]|uniref:chorion peroxidase n=1 Tax=Manduca sexta TaxID=7130 RepID=UPI00188F2634|nr:chorion peroxidase [Manduca sexta]
MQHCPLRGAPKCPPASKRYRTHDGTCNNLHRPRWGSTMTPVQRFIPPSYSDDLQAPRRSVTGMRLPSAREISSLIHQSENVENLGITHLLMQWGQFLDHDVTSSSQSRGFNGSVPRCCKDGGRDFIPREFMHPECFPIPVPPSDPFYGPRGIRCLDFIRSSPAPRDDCALGWREQLNQVSAYIDGSPLYGSSARQSDNLRLFRNGMLQYGRVQQRRPLLPPERKDELCRGGAVSTDCFKSGDARVNEHPGLVAAHIVWLRQHNRMAQELAHLNPHWSDEKIYQETRKIVGAMLQHITYREFLPIVLGSEVIRLFDLDLLSKGYFKEYNPKINPSPASSFGSAAFRFGHSLVQSSMVRFDSFHRPMTNNVSLHDELTNPSNIWSIGAVDRLLLGMVNQPIQHRDEFITDELTNHLFQTPQIDFGMDLAAINIQRGRDHGVPSYTTWREPCGLSVIEDFEDLFRVMPERAAKKLQLIYRHVDDIDLFTGGMAERPVVGGLVGPTFACIIAQQFSNLRKGDRFWYENGGFDSSFTPAQLQQIRRISFAQVLCRTLDTIDTIQPFVFLSPANPDNNRISCLNGLLNNFDLSPWIEIDSDSNNIRTADDEDSPTTSTEKPKRTKPTTTTKRPNTTKKPHKGINKDAQIIRAPSKINTTKTSDKTSKQNTTNDADDDLTNDNTTLSEKHVTNTNKTVLIDDKLDFKNKSRRYDDPDIINPRQNRPNKYDDYEYDDDDTQSVQSVVINNVHHKRPYNRPVITVTENTNKYTYLINYVPRPTESWRQTTRKTHDRDVVKVTYQTYDDTYRRPNKPYYYKKRDNNDNENDYQSRPTTVKDILYYSARSNDATDKTTTNSKTIDKSDIAFSSTTDSNLYKLVTFGYVGSYKGQKNDKTNDKKTTKEDTQPKITDLNIDSTDLTLDKTDINKKRHESLNKDFTTDGIKTDKYEDGNNIKLSTFYLYETATKPYPLHRPTRRNDDEIIPNYSKNNVKYYYVRNVLHKYSDNKTVETAKSDTNMKTDIKVPVHKPKVPNINIEERSSVNKLAALDDVESKSKNTNRQRIKTKKPVSSAKTPSVAFQVIPSENSPTLWAVYEENADLPEILPHKMPMVKTDPHALEEIPRPINLNGFRRRRPGKS